MDTANLTEATREALTMLRDAGDVKWYTVTFLGIVMYVYANEVERRRWDVVAAGLVFFLVDVFKRAGQLRDPARHGAVGAVDGHRRHQRDPA